MYSVALGRVWTVFGHPMAGRLCWVGYIRVRLRVPVSGINSRMGVATHVGQAAEVLHVAAPDVVEHPTSTGQLLPGMSCCGVVGRVVTVLAEQIVCPEPRQRRQGGGGHGENG